MIIMVFRNAGETIGYKCTKTENSSHLLFGVNFWSLILSIPALVISLCINGFTIFSDLNILNFTYICAIALLGMINIQMWFFAQKNLPMSIAEGVSEIYIAFLSIFSWAILGSPLSILQLVLIVLLIIACITLGFLQNKNSIKDSEINKHSQTNIKKYNYKIGFTFLTIWIILSIIRSLLPGAISQSELNGFVYAFVLNLARMIMVIIFLSVKKVNFKATIKQSFKDFWLIIIAVCSVSEQLIILYLAKFMNLGVIDAITVLGLVLIMLYERFILKEKIRLSLYFLMIAIAGITIALYLI